MFMDIYIYREREIYGWSFMDKLVDFRSVDQRIKYKCSWSPTHRRPWCFKHFLAFFSFFDGLACQLAHRRHATLWLSWGGVGWGGVGQ